MRLALALAAAALTLPAGGCCSLARLFCGPDKNPWVSVDFRSPEAALRTMLEALRRDDPETIYQCLSDRYRRDLRVDSQTTQLVWPRIREQNPGLHLAGYADVPEPVERDLDRARFVLDVEGTRVEVQLVRESYWEVRYTRRLEREGEIRYLPGVFGGAAAPPGGFVAVERLEDPDFDRSRVALQPLTFDHEGLDEVPLEQVESAGFERRWRIDALGLLEP